MDLETVYLGLRLSHPIIAGASPLSGTLDGIRRLEDAGAAAIVTASLYEDEVVADEEALEAAAVVGAESHAEVTSYLPPPCGCRTPLESHIETIRRAAESVSVPVIASLSATTREGWIGMAGDLQAAGAAALEINLISSPADPAETSADVEGKLLAIVRDVCSAVQIPVAVKLCPYFTALPQFIAAIATTQADGVVLFNRVSETDIHLETMTFERIGETSTFRDVRLPLGWIALLAGQTQLSLAATGGVEDSNEVVKYLLAGADAVQTASSLRRHGPQHMSRLVEGLTQWLEAHGATSVAEVRGRMSARRLRHPEGFARPQSIQESQMEVQP